MSIIGINQEPRVPPDYYHRPENPEPTFWDKILTGVKVAEGISGIATNIDSIMQHQADAAEKARLAHNIYNAKELSLMASDKQMLYDKGPAGPELVDPSGGLSDASREQFIRNTLTPYRKSAEGSAPAGSLPVWDQASGKQYWLGDKQDMKYYPDALGGLWGADRAGNVTKVSDLAGPKPLGHITDIHGKRAEDIVGTPVKPEIDPGATAASSAMTTHFLTEGDKLRNVTLKPINDLDRAAAIYAKDLKLAASGNKDARAALVQDQNNLQAATHMMSDKDAARIIYSGSALENLGKWFKTLTSNQITSTELGQGLDYIAQTQKMTNQIRQERVNEQVQIMKANYPNLSEDDIRARLIGETALQKKARKLLEQRANGQ